MKKLFFLCIGLLATNTAVAQNVGIGTTTPTANLQVNGSFRLVDGSHAAGRVLTSDDIGLAHWQALPYTPPPPPPPVNYPSVSICCQRWMTMNLDVATYRNGDVIPKVTDGAAWGALTTGAYCYYNNDSTTYAATYGKLYNWYAINDPRGLAPEGWHIPTHFEMTTLSNCLDGESIAGGSLKEKGTTHWNSPNTDATNYSGFTGLPGGQRAGTNGLFNSIGDQGYWWNSAYFDTTQAFYRGLQNASANFLGGYWDKGQGFSVRCLRD